MRSIWCCGCSRHCDRLVDRELALPALPSATRTQLYQRGCGHGVVSACQQLAEQDRAEAPVRDALLAAGPENVAPTQLDGNRIAGDRNIVPDDVTKTEIAVSGKDKVVGAFKLCIDETGTIDSVNQLKTTGFPAYDRTIVQKLHGWRYRPFWVDGRPEAVCTAVTFIYSQH